MILFKTLFFLLIFSYFYSFGQNDCGSKKIEPLSGAIFGPNHLLIFGADTINIDTKDQIIYSCDHCSITRKSNNGVIIWTKDLSKLKCRAISFGQFNRKEKLTVKGYDIYVQFKDKQFTD